MAVFDPPELGSFPCTGFSADCGAHEAPFNVLLTTYTLFERDSHESKLDRAFLKLWQWSCLVLDEAHAVKNRNARRTTHLNRCPSRLAQAAPMLLHDLGKGLMRPSREAAVSGGNSRIRLEAQWPACGH